jgi:hypothetical protein
MEEIEKINIINKRLRQKRSQSRLEMGE